MCSAPVGQGANPHSTMLIGAHVSTSGGLVKAHQRGVELGCDAIQIFNQSPRDVAADAWKDEDIAEFRALMRTGRSSRS